jgi:hypothetical protein
MNQRAERERRAIHARSRLCPTVVAAAFGLTALAAGQRLAVAGEPAARTTGDWRMPTPGQPPRPAVPEPAPAPGGYAPAPGGYAPSAVVTTAPPDASPASAAPGPDQGSAEKSPEDEEPSGPFFDLAAMTVVPITLGGQASIEIPGRILLQGDLGWMPPGYGSAINGLVQSFGAYDPEVGALVSGALDGAFVARLSAGWRPFPSAGFEITGGYTYIGLSGSVDAADVAGALGGEVASGLAARLVAEPIELSSHLHNFHVALGWRWVVWDHLVIRANLGYTQTLGSSSSIDIPGQPALTAIANPVVDQTLGDIYKTYVKLPFIALGAGYRF